MTMLNDDDGLSPELRAAVESTLGWKLDDEETPDPETEDEEDESTGDAEEPDGGDDEGEPESSETPATVPEGDELELAPGVKIKREDALSYWQLDAILRGDQELYNTIQERIKNPQARPQHPPAVAAPEVTPPKLPELDAEYLDDPAIKALYEAAQQQQKIAEEQAQRIAQLTDVTITRDAEEITTIVNDGQRKFQTEHHLNDEQIKGIADTALRLNVIPSLMSGVDPITGQPVPRDRATAYHRALEIAYWMTPEGREREIDAALQDRAKSQKRKQKLAGVSGGSGSVPRGNAPIRNEQDRRAAMIAEVAAMMGRESDQE